MVWIKYCEALLLVLSLYASGIFVQRGNGRGGRGAKAAAPLRAALEEYANSLVPELDYNVTMWAIRAHSRSPSDYFDKYAVRMSNIFKKKNAFINFVSVGACDGITDPIIKNRFLKNEHWRAVFVEPMTPNVRDLRSFIDSFGALNRSLIIQAAATSECQEPTIKVERPLYEERNVENKTIPHWLRRQIGSILPTHRDHARPDWTLEEVRCVTAADILDDWTAAQNKIEAQSKKRIPKTKRMRPHVLKIDVEGHDYEVLMGFLLDEIPVQDLPLIVEFEAKSIAKKYTSAKEHMEKRGYVVSNFAQDGFALLKADHILEGLTAIDSANKRQAQQQKALKSEEDLTSSVDLPKGNDENEGLPRNKGKGNRGGGGNRQGGRKRSERRGKKRDQEEME